MTDLIETTRQASDSRAMSAMARFGLASRAFVYLMIGWLALQIALGHSTEQANQKGALADVASHSGGIAVLWLLGFGFAAYALWRFSEAALGGGAGGSKLSARLKSLGRGLAYAVLCVTTFVFIAGGSRQGQAQQQASWTAKLMKHDYGRWLVGLAGLIVVAVGLVMIVEAIARKFEKELDLTELRGPTRAVVTNLGLIGTTARGIVFAIAGVLVIDAAVSFDPAKSTGLDGALRTLANRAYGPWLLGLVAAGLIAFGVYGFATARWAKVG